MFPLEDFIFMLFLGNASTYHILPNFVWLIKCRSLVAKGVQILLEFSIRENGGGSTKNRKSNI